MANDFSQLGAYQDNYKQIKGNTGAGGFVWNDANTSSKLNEYGNTFTNLFQSLVGRAPSNDELNQIYGSVLPEVLNSSGGLQHTTGQQLGDITKNYIGDNFQKAAQDQAVQELQGQQNQATQLADLFRQQGNTTASSLEGQLQDFVQRTFEKVRPQMITSLQAQGLLNTGAVDQAMAGKLSDLTSAAKDQVFDYRLNNENQANAIQFGGASAPYEYQKALTMGRPDQLLQQAQGGLSRLFQTAQQQQAFAQQVALQNNLAHQQAGLQPSFLRTLGQSTASSLGNSLGQWASPGKDGGPGGATALMALSARDAKKDITKLTEAEEEALYDKMVSLPVSRYRYKTEEPSKSRHVGIMVDEALPEFVSPDGRHLSVVDYLGALTLALKVQNRRMLKASK
jgi:hypothetical protein